MTATERPRTVTEMALDWFERERCTSWHSGMYFHVHHGPTGFTRSALHFDDAVVDLWNAAGRERR